MTTPAAAELQAKKCLVCHYVSGKNKVGRNFGALSCASCTAFFRRTVRSTRAVACKPCDGKCRIHFEVKNKCYRCRLAKCRAVGMDERKKTRFNTERKNDKSNDDFVDLPLLREHPPPMNLFEQLSTAFHHLVYERRKRLYHMNFDQNGSRISHPWVHGKPSEELHIDSLESFTRYALDVDRELSFNLLPCIPLIRDLDHNTQMRFHDSFATMFFIADLGYRTVQFFPEHTDGSIAITEHKRFTLGPYWNDTGALHAYPLLQVYQKIYEHVIAPMRSLLISNEQFVGLLMITSLANHPQDSFNFYQANPSRNTVLDDLYQLAVQCGGVQMAMETIARLEDISAGVQNCSRALQSYMAPTSNVHNWPFPYSSYH
uniref:Nuclear receptor domain-containing protein n=1 Tax=Steinernema glaseri TaxID=37863 RepID=A0A1I7YY63_9BILA